MAERIIKLNAVKLKEPTSRSYQYWIGDDSSGSFVVQPGFGAIRTLKLQNFSDIFILDDFNDAIETRAYEFTSETPKGYIRILEMTYAILIAEERDLSGTPLRQINIETDIEPSVDDKFAELVVELLPNLSVTPETLELGEASESVVTLSNSSSVSLDWKAVSVNARLTLSPPSGSVSGGGSQDISIEADRSGLTAGVKSTTFDVKNTAKDDVTVTVTIDIQPAVLAISPASLSFDGSGSQELSISNTGEAVLNWTATPNHAAITCAPESGTGAATVAVTVDADGVPAGTYNKNIRFNGTGGIVDVPVTIVVE